MHVRGAKHQFYFLDEIPDYKPNKVYNPLLRKLYNRSLNSTQSASRSLNSSKEQVAAQINRFEVQSSSNNPANNLSSSLCRRATSAWWSSTITTRRSGTWPMCRIFSRTLLMCLWLSWMRTTVLPLKTWSLIRVVALTDQWCTMLAMDSLPTISKTIILAQCFMWAMYRMFTSLFSLSMCSSPRSS